MEEQRISISKWFVTWSYSYCSISDGHIIFVNYFKNFIYDLNITNLTIHL